MEMNTDSEGNIDMGMYTINITEKEDMGGYDLCIPVRNKKIDLGDNGNYKILEDKLEDIDERSILMRSRDE